MVRSVDQFLKVCAEKPEAPAVVSLDEDVSYGELRQRVLNISSALQKFEPGFRVAIYMKKSAAAYAAIWGTLHAGGVYAPLNVEAPEERNALILDQFSPDAILCLDPLPEPLMRAAVGADIFYVGQLPVSEHHAPRDTHLAYVMFTSGSTGVPKGVPISRGALDSYIGWIKESFDITHNDRWSQHPNIGFDLSVLDIFGALSQGAALYPLTSERQALMPARFIRDNQITIWNSVPSVIDLMQRARQIRPENLSSLRLVTFCGEPLLARHVSWLFEALPHVRIQNTYGPTEATVSCTAIDLKPDQAYRGTIEIGQPIDGMGLLVDLNGEVTRLNPDSKISGELLISGPQLADGYWKDTEKTAQAFQTLRVDGADVLVYRTGDLVDVDGPQIAFKGRLDHQVKINGHRIELDEIDMVASELGFGASCTVVQNGRLHIFFETTAELDAATISGGLAKHLPPYAVAQDFSKVTQFPKNPNDKIDRKQLEAMLETKGDKQ